MIKPAPALFPALLPVLLPVLPPVSAALLVALSLMACMPQTSQQAARTDAQVATAAALSRAEASTLNAIISLNPDAMTIAAALDGEPQWRSPLHGQPILLKDNIETADAMATTAGSLALVNNFAQRDAPLAAHLRNAGLVILGKANLSEWANFRSTHSTSGWSAVGGQTQNPAGQGYSPCGSSSGSAAAVAAGLVRFAIGTETNGSIECPAAMNGVVGYKPSVGRIAQAGIIPISMSQDSAGPMTRTVADAALLADIMMGEAERLPLFSALETAQLQGLRIGVLAYAAGSDEGVLMQFEAFEMLLRDHGAELVMIEEAPVVPEGFGAAAYDLLKFEFKDGINRYLAEARGTKAGSLTELIAFNAATPEEMPAGMPAFAQDIFEEAQALGGLDSPDYLTARDLALGWTRATLDALLRDHQVDVLIAPSRPPAFLMTPQSGDQYPGGTGTSWVAAIAGYPLITVPSGHVTTGDGALLPVGVTFIGGQAEDAVILQAAHAYEQARGPL
jgi:amidase